MPAKKQANGTRFSGGTQPAAASPTGGSGPGAALISDHDMAVSRNSQLCMAGRFWTIANLRCVTARRLHPGRRH